MAQMVRVKIEFEQGAGLPGAFNNKAGIEVDEVVVNVQMHGYQSDAVSYALTQLRKGGVTFDGPLSISTEKVMQIGGDDGGSYTVNFPGAQQA